MMPGIKHKPPFSIKQLILLYALSWLATIPAICTAEIPAPTIITLNNNEPWIKKLSSNSGKLSFSANLNQNEEVRVIFSANKNVDQGMLFTLITSDKNCIGEHETAVHFRENSKYSSSKYFEEKTLWKNSLVYSITWKDKKNIILTLNEKSISIKINKKPKYIHIQTNGKSIKLQEFLIQ